MLTWFVGRSRGGCLIRGFVFAALLFLGDRAWEHSGLNVGNSLLVLLGAVGAALNLATALIPREKSS